MWVNFWACIPRRLWVIAALVCVFSPGLAWSQPIFVPNHDFQSAANEGIEAGFPLGSDYVETIGAGPWRGRGTGVLGVVLAPSTAIDADIGGSGIGRGIIADLLDANLLGNNTGEIFNSDIGEDFVGGQQYLLTAELFRASGLDATLLSNNGVGIGLLANDVKVASSLTPGPGGLVVEILNANSLRLHLTYTAALGIDGDSIGIRLFAGDGTGLVNLSAFSAVAFDNVTLSAVPEPSSLALTGALLGLGAVMLRRRVLKRQPAQPAPASAS